ncbi:MAG: hypothetical protein WCF98_09385 [Synechococcus sp. ELA057]|jgi:hypothetical protein
MPRTPRRYAIHLILSGGQREVVHFPSMEAFQQWYQGSLHAAGAADAFVNVPIGELEGEYLLVRASSVIGLRVEPQYASLED